jgi:K+-transporting ATPase ATPase C chain
MSIPIRAVLLSTLLIILGTGVAYPLLVAGIARLLFPRQAQGSLIRRHGEFIGSRLIGQTFHSPSHFWTRPSATTTLDGSPSPYNAANSGGSNLSPSNPEMQRLVEERIQGLRQADPGSQTSIPMDLITASGSGLDPHISPEAAEYQAHRVATALGLNETRILELIRKHTEGPQFGVLGTPQVNVLELNLALDELCPSGHQAASRW